MEPLIHSEPFLFECRFKSCNPRVSVRLLSLIALSVSESIHLGMTEVYAFPECFAPSISVIRVTFANSSYKQECDEWIKRDAPSVGQYLQSSQRVSFKYNERLRLAEITFPNGGRYLLITQQHDQ